MAFTSEQLENLESAYAEGVLSVKHADKTVVYASLDDLWDAIQRIRAALTPKKKRVRAGVIGYSKF